MTTQDNNQAQQTETPKASSEKSFFSKAKQVGGKTLVIGGKSLVAISAGYGLYCAAEKTGVISAAMRLFKRGG